MKTFHRRLRARSGQILVGAVLLLIVLAVLVPVMVLFVRTEAVWTAKEQKNTAAFHLSEAAIERGFWRVSQSTQPTNIIPIAGYNFDQAYTDVAGGAYAVMIGSDASKNIIITAVGRDALKREVRAIQAIYTTTGPVSNSLYNFGGEELEFESGATQVEWGPIYSQGPITFNGSTKTYPRLYSQLTIDTYCPSNPTLPCTDAVHWWCGSCTPYIPTPSVDLGYYRLQAQNAGVAPAGCNTDSNGSNPVYYRNGSDGYFKGCQDTSGNVYFLETGKANFSTANPKNFIVGSVVVPTQKVDINGQVGSGAYAATVPPTAWKEYGVNWAHYLTFDPSPPAPAAFPGLNGTYRSTASYGLTGIMIHGFFYAGAGIEIQGGANNTIHGVMIVTGPEFGGGFTLYYDNTVASNLHLTGVPSYFRTSWKDLPGQAWPSGL